MEIVQRYGFSFQKKYGQNFLIDPHVPVRIVEAAQICKEDCVVEIGPGIGTLTQYLAEAAGHVIAVEIDQKLIPILEETLAGYTNVQILNQDILKTDLRQLAADYCSNPGGLKIVANLPYYITTPILMELLEGEAPIRSITVMVQKEVAQRMQAGPGTKDYGALSLAVQYYSSPKMIATVSPNCFVPRPDVESAVIHLDLEKRPSYPGTDEKELFALIRAAFGQRRKTLANSLKNSPSLAYTREQITEALAIMEVSPTVRGEALNLEQFIELERLLRGEDAVRGCRPGMTTGNAGRE